MLLGSGAGPKAFAAIAEYADGWMPIGGGGVRAALPELARAMEKAGRDPRSLSIVPLVVSVPGGPTGTVFNGTDGFVISNGTASAPAAFLFATQDGHIYGWNGTTNTQVGQTVPGAIYTGLTEATTRAGAFLYAANFGQKRIDVFDSSFTLVSSAGGFVDPALPDDYGPFNVQEFGGQIYVAYAKESDEPGEEEPGTNRGFVDVYTPKGVLVSRLVQRDGLNAPWGLALAPKSFGPFGGALLVGNFGNGRIHAYDKSTGAMLGTLQAEGGGALVIDGLWGIRFGNGTIGTKKILFFAAGIDDETHGLFGAITPDV